MYVDSESDVDRLVAEGFDLAEYKRVEANGEILNDGQRTTAPAPNIGIEKYFFEAGEKILGRIKEYRNTVILPERTGPIADVLYSAAGNSADDQSSTKYNNQRARSIGEVLTINELGVTDVKWMAVDMKGNSPRSSRSAS